MQQPRIILEAKEGATIAANLEVEELIAQATTGGVMRLTGDALNQQIEVRARGNFRGENLFGEQVNVKVKGGGNAHINSNGLVNATVKAGGDIYIYGNPEQVIKNAGIGATIQKIN